MIGSADPGRCYEPAVRDPTLAVTAAEEIGQELALRDCRIVVHSGRAAFIEAAVVRGYIASGRARPRSIQTYGRYGRDDTDYRELAEHDETFDMHPEASADWEVSYYRSLLSVDAVLLIGGGRSTFTAGLIALSRRIALAPIAAFGGAAEKVWHRFAHERGFATEEDVTVTAAGWRPGSAADVVSCLVGQHRRQALQQDEEARRRRRADRNAAVGLAVGLALLVGTLTTVPLTYGLQPGTPGSITSLVAAPLLSATCGAIIRNSFDEAHSWLSTTVLGTVAGAITALLFIAAQLVSTPDLLNGEAARRIIFFVIPVGFIGGLTFDAVYAKLRTQDIAQASVIGRE
ncbi:hypothetical protein ABT381_00350 [Streptomyces sp. NPDC000151]|uniref:hypothetical protein n=1 Tax=Streptomyces sp. NPDC000151 TaxID=3154244 RepID=UPI003322C214